MIFEWDEKKRELNALKHSFDFADAIFVFDDPHKVEIVDNRKNYGEIRINTIGLFNSELIVAVLHTDRDEITRIISARRASKKERDLYYGNR